MFYTLAVFSLLSLVNIIILMIEDMRHRKALQKYHGSNSVSADERNSLVITYVRGGKMQDARIFRSNGSNETDIYSYPESQAALNPFSLQPNTLSN